jgi:uncharacterized membrane protein
MPREQFTALMETVADAVELVGVAAVVIGFAVALVRSGLHVRGGGAEAYRRLRHDLGRSILLGLEMLVAGDIIRTVAVRPSLESVAVLAGIVLVRTFLSFSLEVELQGRLPWRRGTSAEV